jgi:SAM-dependent methyltransferase
MLERQHRKSGIGIFSKKIFRRLYLMALNNIPVNNLLILFRKDYLIKLLIKDWEKIAYDENLSMLENSGYSHLPEIVEVLDNCHRELSRAYRELCGGRGKILDLGCGPGLFLKDFRSSVDQIYGLDMNAAFLEIAKTNVPEAKLIQGNYLEMNFHEKFAFIYANFMLMYIERSRLELFFKKLSEDLEAEGVIFISYVHALQFRDILYHDLSYIRYSPALIEKTAMKYFSIVRHEHLYDQRKIKFYDSKHYYFPDGNNNRLDTAQNSYVLIALKKPVIPEK